jgi:hypothetical protein
MPTLQFTTEELKFLQSVIKLFSGIQGITGCIGKSELAGIEGKLDNFIGNPYENLKRAEIEAGMRNLLADDPEGLSSSLTELDRLYPLPEALRH